MQKTTLLQLRGQKARTRLFMLLAACCAGGQQRAGAGPESASPTNSSSKRDSKSARGKRQQKRTSTLQRRYTAREGAGPTEQPKSQLLRAACFALPRVYLTHRPAQPHTSARMPRPLVSRTYSLHFTVRGGDAGE